MPFHPILAAMRRNKFGAILIAVQIAVTLAFITNSFALIEQRIFLSSRATGLDEDNVFVIRSGSIATHPDLEGRLKGDVAALRSLPGVVDAYITNDYPLGGGGWTEGVLLSPDQKTPSATAAHYFGDDHALNSLGVKLIAGRNFTPQEVSARPDDAQTTAKTYIVSKALADKLFPKGDALGKIVWVEDNAPTQIIGIVDRLQTPFYAATSRTLGFAENSFIEPVLPLDEFPRFVIRTQPGRLAEIMKRAEQLLLERDGDRILRTQSMAQLREDAYRGNRGLIVLLVSVCTALLIVTGFGIIGLTSYWVTLRRQQIGIRRALGATRFNIVQYFQTENFMIAATGAAVGVALAIILNLWMVDRFEMVRMADSRALVGALLLVLLGQAAVFWPALKAASIPPALASRGG